MSQQRNVPPGQFVTEKFPVLTYGATPAFDPKTWTFRLFGLVAAPVTLTYPQFQALPRIQLTADFHCVTQWSRLGNRWEGVSINEIVKLAPPLPEARHALIHCDGGYTTNLPLATLLDDDVLLATKHDDANLAPEHGWPLRLIVPKRYAWKSAKWVRGIEYLAHDRPGFWEMHGYHNDADPWREERFSE
ncbi:MAG: sulfite oxidase-like oxidoreductase [Dehalococcoidia bacterium]|nr:sulfite oxidase-like oxidoreductase [Dehalococcoidia bacterium]